MSKPSSDPTYTELLKAALDHSWNWWEFRINSGLQVLSFYLLSSSIMVAAYVSALNAHLRAVAAVVAILEATISCAAFMVGKRQSDVARLAVAPLKEIQGRLAESLDIDSLQMLERYQGIHGFRIPRTRLTSYIIFPMAAIASIVAVFYAIFGA